MVCHVCKEMLEKQAHLRWKGTYDLAFGHHEDEASLEASARSKCCICQVLFTKFNTRPDEDKKPHIFPGKNNTPFFTQASLSYNRQWSAYRLEFRLNDRFKLDIVGNFLLKQLPSVHNLDRPIPNNTSSYANVQLARRWLNECMTSHRMCRHVSPSSAWYPTRLVDMGFIATGYIKVVQPRQHNEQIMGKYVTLSHCWGETEFLKLSKDTLPQFEEGIEIDRLPKTFQHAIDFACRLGVRYIWIDSLCILQDSTKDWLYQSAQMDQVYNNSLCNISATAASNSAKGLYCDRASEQNWVDEVTLNTTGVPGQPPVPKMQLKDVAKLVQTAGLKSSARISQTRQANVGTKPQLKAQGPQIPKYTVLDLNCWETNVEQGPVNKRGWVLQERLIAPRVLHFCKDQIAWECWEKDYIESRTGGLPLYQLKAGSIVDGSRLKGMVPSVDGKALREARLVRGRLIKGKYTDVDAHMRSPTAVPSVHCFEVWNRVVETYSKTKLTKPTDKLIALGGIAKIMSRRILNGKDEDYIAGMWRDNLESQLLWRVDPILRKDGKFDDHSSDRPGMDEYRAPSFSWAAIDAKQGVKCGDVTDFGTDAAEDLMIKIENVMLKHKTADRFGLLTPGGYLELKGVLKKVNIVDSPRTGYTRYHWQLVRSGEVLEEPYKIIYLDAPSSDQKHIIGPNRGVYCLPVCRDRSAEPKELICLLLLAIAGTPNTFKRIGLTKISRYHKQDQKVILELSDNEKDEKAMDALWDPQAKKHTIRII
ncbi:hypothetical protein VTL71DRAFT_7888 [Oculimacula yallundae]|uniref:Heterokaryon incompatibility domain-containing protein n=1 Tax=Oculimacula yallundae TaxID=86028 RepID=A0ABR4CW60_9HELO